MSSAIRKRLFLLPLLVAAVALAVVWGTRIDTGSANPANTMTASAPGTPVGLGSNFLVTVDVVHGGLAADDYSTYQVGLAWDNPGVAYDGTANAHLAGGAGFSACFGFTHPGVTPAPFEDSVSTACGNPAGVTAFTGDIVQFDLKCDPLGPAGAYPLHLVTLAEDPVGGSTTIGTLGPIATILVDGTVTCEAQSDLETVKEAPAAVTTQSPFTYTIITHNTGPQPAVGVIVADALPDLADGDGRGHKTFLGCVAGVDSSGDTVPDTPLSPCVPGFVGPFPNPVPPPAVFNSVVVVSATLMCATFGAAFPACPLPVSHSIVVSIDVEAPFFDAGKLNVNTSQGVLSCTPPTGDPGCTVDPDPTNVDPDCALIGAPAANAGCSLTAVLASAVSVDKSGAPDPVQSGDPITWTVTVDNAAGGSKAAQPYGEGGVYGTEANCADNIDNDGDTDIDYDGGGVALPDSECADHGPVIEDDVDGASQSNITSATINTNTCLETGTTDASILDATAGSAVDIVCSLTDPIPAGTSVVLTIVNDADTPVVTSCDNDVTVSYADAAQVSATASVTCNPAGVAIHLDKGAFVFPNVISVLVGHTATVVVVEQIEIIDAGPAPNLVHNWEVGGTPSVAVDWVEELGDVDVPVGFTNGLDTLTFQTGGHFTGQLFTLDRELDIRCESSNGDGQTLNIVLESIGATTQVSPTTLVVQCVDEPSEVKEPDQANLWLMRHPNCVDDDGDTLVDEDPVNEADDDGDTLIDEDPGPCNPHEGKGSILINEVARGIATDIVPGQGAEGLGAYEKQVKFDHKLVSIRVEDAGFLGSTGRTVNCTMTIVTENWILFGCVSLGPPANGPEAPGPVVLSRLWITPEPDLFNRLRPTKDNGVIAIILDENCEWADVLGHPMAGMVNGGLVPICDDAVLTIRYLEGDINADCNVDVLDEQAIAFRYGATFGLLLYNQFYDLEPILPDFDIDIKDLQFVFGRDGSTCTNPIPAQDPQGAPP